MQVKKNLTTIIFIATMAILLAVFLRSEMDGGVLRGTDAREYINLFNQINNYNNLSDIYYMNDYGFSHYSFIIKKLRDNSNTYLLITFALSTLLLFTSYYIFLKDEQSSFLYIVIFFALFSSSFYFLNLNGIRQGFSISLAMLAFAFAYEKRTITASIFMLLAFLFHKTAIISLVLLLLIFQRSIQINPIYFFYFFSFIGLIMSIDIITNIFNILNLDIITEKVKNLARPSKGNTSVTLKLLLLFTLTNYFAILRSHTSNNVFIFLTNIYILYAGIVMVFFKFEAFVNRLMLFFGILEPIIFVLSIHCFKNKKKVFPFIIIFGLLYFLYVFVHPSVRSELRLSELILF